MKTLFKVAAIGLLLVTSACSSTPIQQTTTIDLPSIAPNLPEAPVLRNVSFHVYDGGDLKTLSTSNPNVILFTLTPDQNAILGNNLVELQSYILKLQQTVAYYQKLNAPAKK